MAIREDIERLIKESIEVKQKLEIDAIAKAVELFVDTLSSGGKILFCGNGGSAADAQHLAAELVVRFKTNRIPYPALSLAVDPSVVTAAANDYGYEHVFERQVQALGREGDLLVAISTSGRSANVNLAVDVAKLKGMRVIYMTGESMPLVASKCDLVINVPSKNTARIQESHITIGHIIIELVERELTEKWGKFKA